MKLTKKKAIKLFRDHWKWLAETGSTEKQDWPDWDFNENIVSDYCFLCEFYREHKGFYCESKCIIKWPFGSCYNNENSVYIKWSDAKTKRNRKKYAKIISELPER